MHGPSGVLDLVVPIGATPVDVGRAYADQSGMSGIPLLQTALGEHLRADRALAEMGVESGAVLIAATGVRRARASEDAALGAELVPETAGRAGRDGPRGAAPPPSPRGTPHCRATTGCARSPWGS